MHHPLIDQKDLRKMPEEKVQELLSELRKKKSIGFRGQPWEEGGGCQAKFWPIVDIPLKAACAFSQTLLA